MLARRKKLRLNKEAPQTEYPRHRKFVRGHVCIVPGCGSPNMLYGPLECCHVRKGLPAGTPSWARGGTSRKPHDAFTFSACSHHHARQHAIGEPAFEKRYGVNLLKEALDLARHSPVDEIRQFVRDMKL